MSLCAFKTIDIYLDSFSPIDLSFFKWARHNIMVDRVSRFSRQHHTLTSIQRLNSFMHFSTLLIQIKCTIIVLFLPVTGQEMGYILDRRDRQPITHSHTYG